MTTSSTRTRLRALALPGLVLLALAGCGGGNAYQYGGMRFPGDAKGIKDNRKQFVATAGPVSASIDGARAAASYEAIKYCIDYLGSSDIRWTIGPDTPPSQLPIEKDKLTYRGECLE